MSIDNAIRERGERAPDTVLTKETFNTWLIEHCFNEPQRKEGQVYFEIRPEGIVYLYWDIEATQLAGMTSIARLKEFGGDEVARAVLAHLSDAIPPEIQQAMKETER